MKIFCRELFSVEDKKRSESITTESTGKQLTELTGYEAGLAYLITFIIGSFLIYGSKFIQAILYPNEKFNIWTKGTTIYTGDPGAEFASTALFVAGVAFILVTIYGLVAMLVKSFKKS